MSVVLQHAPYKGTEKLILLGMANHDGDAGSFPAIGTLARYANCSESTVDRAIKHLIETKAIKRHIQAGGMANLPDYARPNLYEILVECPPNCDKTKKHKPVDKDLDLLWRPGVNNEPPPNGEPRGGSLAEPGGGSLAEPLTVLEPPLNKTGSPISSTSPEDRRKCWACGQTKSDIVRSYCRSCSSAGLDNPILSCVIEGCTVSGKRRWPGQQYIVCAEHKEEHAARRAARTA